jgi:hypothetical protein
MEYELSAAIPLISREMSVLLQPPPKWEARSKDVISKPSGQHTECVSVPLDAMNRAGRDYQVALKVWDPNVTMKLHRAALCAD